MGWAIEHRASNIEHRAGVTRQGRDAALGCEAAAGRPFTVVSAGALGVPGAGTNLGLGAIATGSG